MSPRSSPAGRRLDLGNNAGSIAVEFALIGPVLLAMLLGLVYLAQFMQIDSRLSEAVEKAGRFADINTEATDSDLQAIVSGSLAGLDTTPLTITIGTETIDSVTYRSIQASFDLDIPLYGTMTVASKSLATQ